MDRRHEGPTPGDEEGWPQRPESPPGVEQDPDECSSEEDEWDDHDWGDEQAPIWEPSELEEDDQEPLPDDGDFWIDRDEFAD